VTFLLLSLHIKKEEELMVLKQRGFYIGNWSHRWQSCWEAMINSEVTATLQAQEEMFQSLAAGATVGTTQKEQSRE
jgi:hypothetical protein